MIAFGLSWLISVMVLTLYSWKIQKMDLGVVVIVISSLFALCPAWVLSSAYARTPGIRKQFSTLLKPRGPAIWYLMAWLYNHTNGSILAPALFHPAMNTFGNQFSFNIASRILIIGLAIFAIVYDHMWKTLPPDHPAVYREPVLDDSHNGTNVSRLAHEGI